MNRFLMVVVAGLALASVVCWTVAAEQASTALSGVLIDTKCGKGRNEGAAAKHAKACAIACADSGYELVVGERHYRLDEKGNKLAVQYLAKEEHTTRVVIEGTVKDDGTVAVTAIKPQPATRS